MGVHIAGMEMPKRGHTVTLTIMGGGEAVVQYYDCKPQLTVPIVYKAIPVPEHGRLVDARHIDSENDRFFDMSHASEEFDEYASAYAYSLIANILANAPTVIPADLPVMEYPQVPGITPTVIAEEGEDNNR